MSYFSEALLRTTILVCLLLAVSAPKRNLAGMLFLPKQTLPLQYPVFFDTLVGNYSSIERKNLGR